MGKVLGIAMLAISVMVATLVAAGPAMADTIEVHQGQSIQAAVNRAHAGDTILVHPGVYHESVLITKNHLTLVGAGDSKTGTVLKHSKATKSCPMNTSAGFCVFGTPKKGGGIQRRLGTTIRGFLVEGYHDFGVVSFGATSTLVAHVAAKNNGEYGITSFASRRSTFAYNIASGSGEAGFYYGDTALAGGLIKGNLAYGNTLGVLLRDAAVGTVADNRFRDNCMGVLILNTGAPNRPHDWVLRHNDVFHNNRFCPGDKEHPAFSGTGIGLAGGRQNLISHNHVWSNRPSKPSPFSGGIVLVSSKSFGGSNESGNLVRGNVAYRNKPADIIWDGKGNGNRFRNNNCGRSVPGSICH